MTAKRTDLLDRIVQDPAIMVGKPIVAGTRIPVATVLAHLASDPDFDNLFAAFPNLRMEDVKAVFAHAHVLVDSEWREHRVTVQTSDGSAS
jgi:uncharacterized protein (DUF433 family)